MIFSFGEFELDEERFELRCADEKVAVQPKVVDVLLHLVRARERVVLKRELLDAVWPGVAVSDASIARVIMGVRKAIADDLQQIVVTVRGRGFRFAAPVAESTKAPSAPSPAAEDPTFVGRVACMTALKARFEQTLGGRGSLVWISGESGIGKTRSAEELARRARARGAAVFTARAHETPAPPPFWPWAQIVRAFAESDEQPATAQFVQAIAPILSGAAVTKEVQFALFDELTRFFIAASRARPILIVLDDMHWADEGSLRLLQFFARETRESSIMVVGTYRDTALTGDARARALGGLLREYECLAISLRGFGLDEIPRFVEVTSGVSPSIELAKALHERSGGSPLFLHQLLKTEWAERALDESAVAVASSMDLHQGLIESICRHMDSVSAATRDLLTVAAVIGREFELAKLSMVSGLWEEDLLDRLDEAARRRLLVKKDGTYRFAHWLVREVLYKKLSSAERASRHRAIAEQLVVRYGDSADLHATELAHHFARALPGGDPERALEFSIRAAEQEAVAGSHRAALRHWEDAMQALALLRSDDPRRLRAQLGRAQSRAQLGDGAGARTAFLDAATLGRTFGDAHALAEAALGFAALASGDAGERCALLDEARLALGDAKDERAALLKARLAAAR